MALAHSKGMPAGTKAPDFSLKGVDGKMYSLDSFKDSKALVIVFTCNHCPYAVAWEDRLIQIQHDYQDKGVQIVAINPNDAETYPDDSFDNMVKRSREKGYPYPYLYDETQETARTYDAVCTPDIFVFGPKRKLFYNGRLDDNWKEPDKVTKRDLRAAIDRLLADEPLDFDPFPSMGCSIKWKRE